MKKKIKSINNNRLQRFILNKYNYNYQLNGQYSNTSGYGSGCKY